MRELEFAVMLMANLTTLIGTQGVDLGVKEEANDVLGRLMKGIIKPGVTDFLAAKSGIIT